MDHLVKFIAQSLVDKPEDVKISVKEEDDAVVIELTVAPGGEVRREESARSADSPTRQ